MKVSRRVKVFNAEEYSEETEKLMQEAIDHPDVDRTLKRTLEKIVKAATFGDYILDDMYLVGKTDFEALYEEVNDTLIPPE